MKNSLSKIRLLRIVAKIVFTTSLFISSDAFDCAFACSCIAPPTDQWEIVVKEVNVDGETIYSRSNHLDSIKESYLKMKTECEGAYSYYEGVCVSARNNYFDEKEALSGKLPKEFAYFKDCELVAGSGSNDSVIRCRFNMIKNKIIYTSDQNGK